MRRLICLSTALLLGCATKPTANLGMLEPKEDPKESAAESKIDAKLAAPILEAVASYKKWTRVSDHAHWAPYYCRAPVAEGAQLSESKDDTTHGRKLYYLFAKESNAYTTLYSQKDANPIGQALVKESFVPVEVDPKDVPNSKDSFGQATHPPEYATADGKAYKTGEQGPLFVMVKLDPKTPGTDEGWVYGAVKPDGKTLLDAGRIASCMGCHTKTTHDRLFGLAYVREQDKRAKSADAPKPDPKSSSDK